MQLYNSEVLQNYLCSSTQEAYEKMKWNLISEYLLLEEQNQERHSCTGNTQLIEEITREIQNYILKHTWQRHNCPCA
jgi:hypothetical protein